ncbi:hypothetical protein GE061_009292 [Apolygus lucorum]|uniref:Death domain-containing protein n=1 Tax=Apolygus lucorum TaxID=248454 RepID=A0A8S9Y189_APOLU|nr:hypothetical protein GE061_009292 [Apolygus lucorum]
MDLRYRSVSCRFRITIELICFWISSCTATIDINLAQLQYISNHLRAEECTRLSAALHTQTFRLGNKQQPPLGLSITQNDASCLDLILQWNSDPGEGKGKTQEEMAHRLIQIGRPDLANWLTTTVFRALANELLEALQMPDGLKASDNVKPVAVHTPDVEVPLERMPWRIHDTLLVAASCSVLIYLIAISCKALRKAFNYKRWARNKTNPLPTFQ